MSYLRLERNEMDRNKQFVSVENFSIFLLLVTMVPILQEVRLFYRKIQDFSGGLLRGC